MSRLKLLITSGATREPIDGVRYISNISTGRTGARLAEFFSEIGFAVTCACGEGSVEPRLAHVPQMSDVLRFSDYASLDTLLQRELGTREYFAVIHLAAVADYSVGSVKLGERSFSPHELSKIDSGEEPTLVLKRNTKILDRLKEYSCGTARVVGFKLTHGADERRASDAVAKLASSGGVDFVVHNDLTQIRADGVHRFEIFKVRGRAILPGRICQGTEELGTGLVEFFREHL